ncbi:MAG: hypothetical protein JJ934_11770 [Pseudomonadales bacterium]|nr:hypothetical protein [Pseudomonadales bacterium]MBO6565500.1 hypothetical protein [Pseudomonadales bacterium]MBO6595429.1 hypothetical protein [Pseudomonadales bacterium]MBO6657568.1 hypothetical protein [Pseudomonadales bacterium]MBO6701929.1 hypothetical protein [Pseudomonadales bacterium]
MKVVIGVVVFLVLAMAGAGIFLLQNLDGIVKDLIEDIGTDVVGQKVSVADVKVSLGEGSASISGLTVANPPGFSSEPVFSLGNIKVAIDTGSITGPVYVINEISVSDVSVLAEQKGMSTNVQALLDGMPQSEAGEASTSEAGAGSDVLLAIDQVNFANGNMELRSDQFENQKVELKRLNLRNLGTPENGLTPEEVGAEVANQLVDQITDAVTDAIAQYARKEAEKAVKAKLGEKLGDLFK